MELETPAARRPGELCDAHFVEALLAHDESACANMSFAERLQAVVDEAYAGYSDANVKRLSKKAKLRYPSADVRRIDYDERRHLDAVVCAELATCGFVHRNQNLVLQGATGSGKSWFACAIANRACEQSMRAFYVRMPDLADSLAAEKTSTVPERLKAPKLLVVDEWLLKEPDESTRLFLLEVMERRYGFASTVFCTQYKKEDWHYRLEGTPWRRP
jgi:DNA replication protein DnaC